MALYNSLLLVTFVSFIVLVQAQDQSGFVSIDCGLPDGSRYIDETTDINYTSHVEFFETGTSHIIDTEFRTSSLEIQFNNVRSFPQGKRNCYHHLIRTRFMYGNYDGQHLTPEFDLYLGVNLWDSVILDNETTIVTKEIIHTLGSDHVQVCLVDKGRGTPFMSVLELRLLKNDMYETPHDKLMLIARRVVGSISNISVRYKDDAYDRLWTPRQFENFTTLNTSLSIDQTSSNCLQPPLIVMRTANAPRKAIQYIDMFLEPKDPKGKNETREFTVLVNGEPMEPTVFSPRFLFTDTISNKNPVKGSRIEISIRPTNRSTLQPIINAIEVYQVNESLQPPTHQLDVDAIMKIKAMYRVKKDWQGDPCVPIDYSWEGLNCENPPRILLCENLAKLIYELILQRKLGKKQINGLASTKTTGEIKHRITEAKRGRKSGSLFIFFMSRDEEE
ncbi:hypothetical protein Bca52824_074007 [Brassica carinata]|uniref:Malectin-like domain-containing protein n=1 Tax=Brassica carinata TaxID=52824 RepID=A0A8X7QF39_BRACI|nr:hypothetical protein Bca52824_074007 [Brassica carinata]